MSTQWSPHVARAMHELSNAAPEAPSAIDLDQHQPTPRQGSSRWVTAAAAILVVVAIVGLVAIVRRDDSQPSVGPAGVIDVHHTRVEVSIEAQLSCDRPIDTIGTFPTAVVDTYSDRTGRQWRTTITYPDGSTHDQISTGSAIYPTGSYERGEYRNARLGCIGPNDEPFVLGDNGTGGIYALTLSSELAPDERPYVRLFSDEASQVAGDHVDSRGRPSTLWEFRGEGSAGYGNTADHPTLQILDWWVDPADGTTVTQHQFTNTVDQLGTVTTTETLVTDETITVPAALFDPTGYQSLPTAPRPKLNDPPSGTLSSVSPSTIPALADADVAVWNASPEAAPSTTAQSFIAQVTRLGCNDGITGNVNAPNVQLSQTRIVITFSVERATAGAHTCPGNAQVRYTVNIGEPIGNRQLIDGACVSEGKAKTTSFCSDAGVRWNP